MSDSQEISNRLDVLDRRLNEVTTFLVIAYALAGFFIGHDIAARYAPGPTAWGVGLAAGSVLFWAAERRYQR